MNDRESHRAAVESGYADLREYVDRWNEDITTKLMKKPPVYEDAVEAAELITQLRKEIDEMGKQARDIRVYYHQFHNDVLNYLLKKDLISSFMKYRKKRKRELAIFEEE